MQIVRMSTIHITMSRRVQPDSPPRHPHWEAWRLFFETHARVIAQIEAELQAAHGLSLRWYDVLLHLYAAGPEGLSMSELAGAVVISRSGLTGLIDRMATAGLVARSADPADRRSIRLALSEAGRAAYERARPTHRAAVAAHFLDHLDGTAAAGLLAALRRV